MVNRGGAVVNPWCRLCERLVAVADAELAGQEILRVFYLLEDDKHTWTAEVGIVIMLSITPVPTEHLISTCTVTARPCVPLSASFSVYLRSKSGVYCRMSFLFLSTVFSPSLAVCGSQHAVGLLLSTDAGRRYQSTAVATGRRSMAHTPV